MSRTNESVPETGISRVHRLETPVEWPPGHAAAYLLGDEEPICVDAGMVGDEARAALFADLRDGGYEPADVEHLLLTHVHIDHVGGVRPLLETASPTVYAPAIARERLSRDLETVRSETRRNLTEAGLYGSGLERAVDGVLEIHEGIRAAFPLEDVDVWIDTDEPVSIAGRKFDPIYTPGHHVTHHCYGTDIDGARVLFAGDMVVEPFRAAAIHVNLTDGVRDGIDAYRDALERLDGRAFDRVYPGHGPVHDAYDETVAFALEDLADRLAECRDRVASVCAEEGSASAFDLAVDRTDHPRRQVMELREILAALGTLERRGQVRSRLEDGVRLYEPT
ncbi:MBL fold metallo-hydrolase [Natrarchaeobaculum aegyptiacum]|uniref:Hydroxyacylglutathione hydrolase n=1 Tax=Natrarchaeobaculum aegyptiacum TaxID=745377 RepID=A0A2Z2HSV8_9EURY|nr:MBL fold metallo-hydrolase [Natrarchaeobaculum aegyptiacum]ARS90260.1 hydroxyacylglutathione hydrolase [Natrarchaeobaculum aegyptiacum]